MLRTLLPALMALTMGCAEPADDVDPTPDPGEVFCDNDGTTVGDCALDFTLDSSTDEQFTLSDTAGQRVIMIGTAAW